MLHSMHDSVTAEDENIQGLLDIKEALPEFEKIAQDSALKRTRS